ncbi:hypothetical protein MYCOZU1_00967 [Mycobacterium intracellulare subsp. chimaera]|jgi:hypothetical protein|uniref:Uncharacterized protein n=1 Tax=Mycobacterium intracellulare subsp. chimaera TaxID=222805 RepID=A0A220Y6W1_MYCIT|nr:hypothetical protein MYCODSM44623_00871 [Mycobacterium intracellulare subsp. chimaera]ASL13292.1 hypothetical protein MYCOZU2_00840 [Mycobacterium intracellulare subsp. chimaera]ASL19428.1 hypothetical protein MYCOZU1_00967 [Mycobacterium intracellulare subsp. chimaera]
MIAAQEERRHHDHRSRCLSAIGIRFLSILFPPRDSAPLTIGLPARRPDPTGFPRSAHTRYGRGGRPLYPETSGVRTTGLWPPVAACRHCQRPGPITRVLNPSSRASNNEASSRVHSHSPVRPSLARSFPQTERGPLGFFPELRTPTGRTRRRTSGRGSVTNTNRELRDRHRRPPLHELTHMRDIASHPQTSDLVNSQAAARVGCVGGGRYALIGS